MLSRSPIGNSTDQINITGDGEMRIIKVICGWCGKDMGTKDGLGINGISHGMCQECFDKEMAKLEEQPMENKINKEA